MPDFSTKKIIFADVDDTVCPSTQPLQAPIGGGTQRLIDSGRMLAFISGSTVAQLWEQLGKALSGDFQLLGASGTHYVRVKAGQREEVYQFAMPEAERARILGAIRGLAGRHAVSSMTTADDQVQDRQSQITFSAIGRHAPDALKRSFDPTGNLRAAWVLELAKELGEGYSIRVGGTTPIDVTRSGLDKGWGIKEFLKFHRLDAADAVFFGDKLKEGGNDYPARAVVECVEVRSLDDTLSQLRLIHLKQILRPGLQELLGGLGD